MPDLKPAFNRKTTPILEKLKTIGTQVISTANNTADALTTSVKDGCDSLTNTAASMADSINEKAVRASTGQMCRILEIAIEELKSRPLSAQTVSITATVNIGIASLEMQIHLPPSERENSLGEAVIKSAELS
jgi:hypothetical protein